MIGACLSQIMYYGIIGFFLYLFGIVHSVFWFDLSAEHHELIPSLMPHHLSINGNANPPLCDCFSTAFTHNVFLFVIFFVAHSGMIMVKSTIKSIIPYNGGYDHFFAIVSFYIYYHVMYYFQPMNTVIFQFPSWAAPILYVTYVFALGLIAFSTVYMDFLAEAGAKLCTHGIYSIVRHPVYTGLFMLYAGQPTITYGTLFYAVISLTYTFLAVTYLEEPRLIGIFGDEYKDYMNKVSGLCPFSKPCGKKAKSQ